MIPLVVALLVALAIYSTTELLQNHFFFQNYSSKISIKGIRSSPPLNITNVCIKGQTRGRLAGPNFFKNLGSQLASYKDKEFVSGFV